MDTTTRRAVSDRCSGIHRMIRALGRDPAEWELDDLQSLRELAGGLQQAQDRAVYALRDSGHTDAEIGTVLGITRQAVSKRWPGGGRYVGAAGRYRQNPNMGSDLCPSS